MIYQIREPLKTIIFKNIFLVSKNENSVVKSYAKFSYIK